MVLTLLLCCRVGLAAPVDSSYSSPALREFVSIAAEANRRIPVELSSYQARVESEFVVAVRDTLGRESRAQVEQIAADANWVRHEGFALHLRGYRGGVASGAIPVLDVVRRWGVPMLYGERLMIGMAGNGTVEPSGDTLIAVHPFAMDREKYYRFSGGDTVAVIHTAERAIPVVRVRVEPRRNPTLALLVFRGELDVDAERHEIVRMRGEVAQQYPAEGALSEKVEAASGLVGATYIEFVNAQIDGKYWLPARQRTEVQLGFAWIGRTRAVLRIVSTFGDYSLKTDGASTATRADRITLGRVSWARRDSVDSFDDWRAALGEATSATHADDFDEFAPAGWRSDGPPRLTLFPFKREHLVHFDRVEGLYTGMEGVLEMRDLSPGVTARVFGGWAWAERTARGGMVITRSRQNKTFGFRAERELASTNDFPARLLDTGHGFGALFGAIDDHDYVDRRVLGGWLAVGTGANDRVMAIVDAGVARDGSERARVDHGLFSSRSTFPPNRGALDGSYGHLALTAEANPRLWSSSAQQGIGAQVRFDAGYGALTWQRAELAIGSRYGVGAFSLSQRVDVGLVRAAIIPPQQLFEIGGTSTLPGFSNKAFAGDRAALFRVSAAFALPVLRSPIKYGTRIFPSLSPGIGAGIQGGWTELSTDAAIDAARRLGVKPTGEAFSTSTGRLRATVSLGVTLFANMILVGVARPIDEAGSWRFSAGRSAYF